MEERKIRVAITHGDTNGIGYEVILKTFDDPTMLELCTPIIYGSPKAATYHRNALQLQTPFSIISHAAPKIAMIIGITIWLTSGLIAISRYHSPVQTRQMRMAL